MGAYNEKFLDPDLPLAKASEDRLQVSAFVRRLVRPLLALPPRSSLVFGLYGEWGYGKSTAINFLEEAMGEVAAAVAPAKYAELPAPLVVRFTPWLYSNVDALLASFFETIATALNEGEHTPEDKKKGRGRALKALGEIVVPAAKVGAMFLPLGGVVADRLIDHVAELVGGVTKGAAAFVEGGEITFRRRKADAERALLELWPDQRAHRLVVLVDDLDRAAPEEVLAMLRLIKLIADLPNVTYVVAMDKRRVAKILDRQLAPLRGEDFLEKIMQVGVELPPFETGALSRMAVAGALAIARQAGLQEAALEVDWSSWQIIRAQSYELHLRRALRTPRDVTRLLNTFRFALLTGDGEEEVSPVDMLLLCLLQTRYPRVYAKVRENRAFLLREEEDMISLFARDSDEGRRQRSQTRLDLLAAIVAETDEEVAAVRDALQRVEGLTSFRAVAQGQSPIPVEIVLYLFPAVSLEGDADGSDEAQSRRECRLRAPEHFARYFRLERPEAALRIKQIDQVFALLTRSTPDASTARQVRDAVTDLTPEQMGDLTQGIVDRAMAMSREHAMTMLRAAVTLVDVEAPKVTTDLIATLVLRGVSRALSLRGADTVGDGAAFGRDVVLDLVEHVLMALSDDDAATLAREIVKDPGRSLGLEKAEVERIAALGTDRALAFLRAEPDTSTAASNRAFVDGVWRCRGLAVAAGIIQGDAPYEPLATYLTAMLEAEPSRVSEMLSLGVAWSSQHAGHPIARERPLKEMRAVLATYTDLEVLERHAAAVMAGEGADTTRWPDLLREFARDLRQADAGAATAESPQ